MVHSYVVSTIDIASTFGQGRENAPESRLCLEKKRALTRAEVKGRKGKEEVAEAAIEWWSLSPPSLLLLKLIAA